MPVEVAQWLTINCLKIIVSLIIRADILGFMKIPEKVQGLKGDL
jgi:hypothetical protein